MADGQSLGKYVEYRWATYLLLICQTGNHNSWNVVFIRLYIKLYTQIIATFFENCSDIYASLDPMTCIIFHAPHFLSSQC